MRQRLVNVRLDRITQCKVTAGNQSEGNEGNNQVIVPWNELAAVPGFAQMTVTNGQQRHLA